MSCWKPPCATSESAGGSNQLIGSLEIHRYTRLPNQRQKTRPSRLDRQLRPRPNREFDGRSKLKIAEQSFTVDAAKIWNNAQMENKKRCFASNGKKVIIIYCKNSLFKYQGKLINIDLSPCEQSE